MKKSLLLLPLMVINTWAGFDFGECSGKGTFQQQINKSDINNHDDDILIGKIPQGIEGLRIDLISDKDVDIRLYGENADKVVRWPDGLLRSGKEETKSYKDTAVTYSGYSGTDNKLGHEFILLNAATPTEMTMKAFGYQAGYATVNYSWTGTVDCSAAGTSGSGAFEQEIFSKKIVTVGKIPEDIDHLEVNLTSDADMDIQLYAEDGTVLVGYDPTGLLSGANKSSIDYHGMHIEWSGYNGTNGKKGHEYIKVTPKTTEKLTMKVYGFQSGYADVKYSWGEKTTLPLLVVRIGFADQKFTNSEEVWYNKLFGTKTSQLNHYYNEISSKSFKFVPAQGVSDVVNKGIITVNLAMNHPHTRGKGSKLRPIFLEVMNKINPYIDFSTYDTDNNKAISRSELQIMFLIAGNESSFGDTTRGVWAHKSSMGGVNLDGVHLMHRMYGGTYSVFGERHNKHDATIGIIAHELGHAAFGLPDLYDTNLTNGISAGVGNFGLMAAGSWGYKSGDTYVGQTPPHMIGWSKIQAGFIKPTTLTQDTHNLSIKGTALSGYALYKIPTDDPKEYFLFENRANKGYDRGLYILHGPQFEGGLLITHIDENMRGNQIETQKLVDVEEANDAELDSDVKSQKGHSNNLFFEGNVANFNDSSTVNSNTYDGSSTGIAIENISAVGDTMHADITVN